MIKFALRTLAASLIVGMIYSPAIGKETKTVYTYTLSHQGTTDSYDEAMAAACLQGIINRKEPRAYVLSQTNSRPDYWLRLFTGEGKWLHNREISRLSDLDALVKLAGASLKGAVIWDPAVPATINVATTIAGVKDVVVLSPEYADRYLKAWDIPVIYDLRGKFTGSETGSRKNDAYRWAIREYLKAGSCSSQLLCLFEDAWRVRDNGSIGYVVTRDWAVSKQAFVFDLSPWGDEKPGDDLDQPMGTDLDTYNMILDEVLKHSNGKHMTELTGFFSFLKYSNVPGHNSKHEPVPTEWESVHVMSPYNCYQNTISSDCFNQSFHSQAPVAKLKQHRPKTQAQLKNKVYICVLMADYDSATPLYDWLPKHWSDPNRGKVPLAWGMNPNLMDTYPDIMQYFFSTATDNDYILSDASAAGYMNPTRIRKEYMPLFVKHNKHYFKLTDMTIAPMVLDSAIPTPEVKDAFVKFAPDGIATIILDHHEADPNQIYKPVTDHIWKGMPVTNLLNDTCNFANADETAQIISSHITKQPNNAPTFYFFRIVWTNPSNIIDTMSALRSKHPELDIEVVDPYTYFNLMKQSEAKKAK
ncbi:MAG: GxGYxYP domain-containing protein [Armatimonadota bacterium]